MEETVHLLNQSQLVCAIKSNDATVLKSLYTNNYSKIEALILKNSGSVEHAKDIYQDAFTTLWKNIKNDAFVPQNNTAIQGYLYTIAKNKWTDVLRSKAFKNSKPLNAKILAVVKDYESAYEPIDLEDEKLKSAMDAFKILGQPCKKLLSTFYFEKKSLKDIASELNIEETTARNKKYRCMQKLRSMVLAPK